MSLQYINPVTAYRMCVEEAFVNAMEGPHVEALRRAWRVLTTCTAYRGTEEFENLISFEERDGGK